MHFLLFLLLWVGSSPEGKPIHTTPSSIGACELYNLVVDKGACTSDSTYALTFDFDYQGVGGDSFKLWINGQYHGIFTYAALPVTIPHFPKSGGSHDWIKVCDQEWGNCCRIKEFPTAACGGGQDCAIDDLVVETGDCTSDSTYTLTLDFQVVNAGSSQFRLYANGSVFGDYDYADLPLTIQDFPQGGGNNDWLKVCDKEWESCCAIKEFPNPGCGEGSEDCQFKELSVIKECDGDSIFYVVIDFIPIHPVADGFRIKGNGVTYGEFPYSDLPVTLGPLPANCQTPYEFLIQDLENPECKVVHELGKVCCGEPSDCQIKELQVIKECDGDSLFYVQIDFVPIQPGNQGFKIQGNGVQYGTFQYADLPILLGPLAADCHTSYEFLIQDLANPDCKKAIDLGKVCCGQPTDCQIKELEVVKECDGDSLFYVEIDFLPVQPGNQGFKIQGNGVQYGTFQYADLPILLGPLAADCHTPYEFLVQDIAHPDCKKAFDLGKVCCGQPAECQIKELQVDLGDCTSDSTYSFTLNFAVVPPSAGHFNLWVNGQQYGPFSLDSLPLLVENVQAGNGPKDKVKVCTAGAPLCCGDLHFTPPACIHEPIEYLTLEGKTSSENAFNALVDNGNPKELKRASFTLLGPNGIAQPFTMYVEEEKAWQIRLIDMQGRLLLEARGTGLHGPGILLLPSEARSGILLLHIQTGHWTEVHKLPVFE